MAKLTYEFRVTLAAIGELFTTAPNELAKLVRQHVTVSNEEIKFYTQYLVKTRFVKVTPDGVVELTGAGEKQLERKPVEFTHNKTNEKTKSVERKPAVQNTKPPVKKEHTVSKINSDIAKSIASLRSKLEAEPAQKIEQFEEKVETLEGLMSLPYIEQPLADLLASVKADLVATHKAAQSAEALIKA